MRRLNKTLAAGLVAAAATCAGVAHADTFFLNYELPGVQNTTAGFSTVGVETFDSRTSGSGFTTDFGTNNAIAAVYSPLQINGADQYGSAGGVGKYAVAFGGNPYSLKLTADPSILPNGVNYFGYWLSALDGGNQVSFYRAGSLVGSLSPGDVTSRVSGNSAYYGNPNANFLGQNRGEPYSFINFYDTDGSFDEVRFQESPAQGGYESDNHTVGFYTTLGGSAVPEPGTWAMMIAGMGIVGGALRSRRNAALTTAMQPA